MSKEALVGRQTPWAIGWVLPIRTWTRGRERTGGSGVSPMKGCAAALSGSRWTGDRWTEDEFTDGKFTDEQTWEVVEPRGVEPLTFSLRTRRSTN